MRALVLGGSGFIGRWIVRGLMRRGTEVAVFHRGRTTSPPGAAVFKGDRESFSLSWPFMEAWKPDAIIDVRCMNVKELKMILPQVKKSMVRYVFISSVDVYRAFGAVMGLEQPGQETPVTEKSPLRTFLYPYAQERPRPGEEEGVYDKIPVEEMVRRELGPAGVILRLPMVYGPGDRQRRLWPQLSRMKLGRPWLVMPSTLASWRAPRAFVGDVGEAVALCALHPLADGRTYHVCEPGCDTTQAWVERIAEGAKWKGEIRVVEPDKTPEWLQPGFCTDQPLVLDSERIRLELGYREIFSPEEAMDLAVRWELENPGPLPSVDELAREEALVGIRGRKKGAPAVT